MEDLFEGIPLDRVSTSMTINATASVLLALYVATAKRRGIAATALTGTVQNDILKEYIAHGTYIFPPPPSMRLVTDTFAYCRDHVPRWNTISISGYHMREAGCTAVQEVAFTLANGMAYVRAALDAGLGVDEFAPQLSFFFNAQQPRRGSREVPGGAAALGAGHAGHVRRARSAVTGPALPRPDRSEERRVGK